MKTFQFNTFIFSLIFSLILAGCGAKTNSTKTNTITIKEQNQVKKEGNRYDKNIKPGQSYGSGSETQFTDEDSGHSFRWHLAINAFVKGNSWSSATNLPSDIPPEIFSTDQHFYLRIITLEGVKGGCYTKTGASHPSISRRSHCLAASASGAVWCNDHLNHTKLRIEGKLRARGATTGVPFSFNNILVNGSSPIKKFSPVPVSSNPLVLDVTSLESDYDCRYYVDSGYTRGDPTWNQYCLNDGLRSVHTQKCVKLKIQIATDSTKIE